MPPIITIIISSLLCIVLLMFLFWRFWFLRDPERQIPSGDVIVSPADGKVLEIKEIELPRKEKKGQGMYNLTGKGLKSPSLMISIFMSPMDVHVNRSPVEGVVKSITYLPGSFHHAGHDGARMNESNEIIIDGGSLKLGVIQVAGALARRIECHVEEGQQVLKGERIGLINLGSRVTLLLPKDCRPAVEVGERVWAGSSIIAKWGEKN